MQRLEAALRRYVHAFPEEAKTSESFIDFLRCAERPFHRETPDGHFTASCWLVSGDGERVLLTHHRKLGRWLQLGGHADGDADLPGVCLREAYEESGLQDLTVEPEIFDIDAHTIPARGNEPSHTHWDVRYVVHCRGSETWQLSDESLALAWVKIADLDQAQGDESLRRMARKWRVREADPGPDAA